MTLLPEHITVVGIDEHSALVMDFETAECQVMGLGGVTVIASGQAQPFVSGQGFPLTLLGPLRLPEASSDIPSPVWEEVLAAEASDLGARPSAPEEVITLVDERQAARARRDWAAADALRERIAAVGWSVLDTPEGPRLEPNGS